MRILFIFLLVAVAFQCTPVQSSQQAGKKPEVIAYFTSDAANLATYDLRKVDQVIYSFLHLKGNELHFDTLADKQQYEKMVELKNQFPHLKILLSLGGWGGCYTCSDVFSTDENRKGFAHSVKKILENSGGDGIDLDWEYPGIEGHPGHPWKPEDKLNFTALVQDLRQILGDSAMISFAAGGFPLFLENSVDWEKVMPLVNNVNLMTYDLVSGYSTVTGHHTALFSRPEQVPSTDQCVQYLLSIGVPSEKMIIGTAFYARTWENVEDLRDGLYQSGKFKNFIAYRDLDQHLGETNGFIHFWDDSAKAPFAYSKTQKTFATFDNKRSLKEKVDYVKKYHLGGIMFWELSLDKTNDGLLDVISNSLSVQAE